MPLSYEDLIKKFKADEMGPIEPSRLDEVTPESNLSLEELMGKFTAPQSAASAVPSIPRMPASMPSPSMNSPLLEAPLQQPLPINEDDELDKAKAARDREQSQALILRGMNQIGAALGRTQADTGATDLMFKNADRNLSDVQAKRKNEQEKLENKLGKLKLGQAEQMQDPKSEVSAQYRQFAKNLGINVSDSASAASMEKLAPLYEKYMAMKEASASRNLQRELAQSSKEQIREDKKEKEAKLSDKQVQTMKDFEEAQQTLEDLKAGFKPGYVGPLDQYRPDFLSSPDQSVYSKLLGRYKDAYRKAITGAGASSKEIEMLESRLPNLGQKEENYTANLAQAEKEASAKKENFLKLLEKQGKKVDEFKSSEKEQLNSDTVRVQLPDGRTGVIPRKNLEKALKKGAKEI